MPRPIAPPPPQATEAETRLAVRFLFKALAVGLAFFLAISSTYGPHGFFERYGWNSAQAWTLWRVDNLAPENFRAHASGKVVWMVGSSILRESFDEKGINARLADRDSDWRVVKLGMTRGATGVSAGLLKHLPVRPGDMLVHNASVANFREDWVDYVDLPADRLSLMLTPREMWEIEDLSLPARLEQASAVPWDFYRYHEAHMLGWWRWIDNLIYLQAPRPRTKSFHLRYRKWEELSTVQRSRELKHEDRNWMGPDDLDLSGRQFNMKGLARMRAFAEENQLEFALIDIPPRQEYQAIMLHDEVRTSWLSWTIRQPDLSHFPQQPDTDYYDMKHPNFRGRESLSKHLVTWLEADRPRGMPAVLRWTVPEYNRKGNLPPPTTVRASGWRQDTTATSEESDDADI